MCILCLDLEFLSSEQVPLKWYFEKLLFSILKKLKKNIRKKPERSIWMIVLLLSHSLAPWSYGMCSYFRDPKPPKWRRWLALRGCPFGGQDNLNKRLPCKTSQMWNSATCRKSSHVNCMSGSRDNFFQPNRWDPGNTPCIVLVPLLWSVALISRCRPTIHMENY
jgi:hypothetical protein